MSKPRQYIDFKLFLTQAPGGTDGYQVSLLPTAEVGETVLPLTLSSDALDAPKAHLPYLADKSITLRNLVKLGKALSDLLLPEGDIRDLFKEALKRAGNSGGVRLRLIIADHELKQIPWEYLYLNLIDEADSMRGFLALEPRISIVRHEPLPQSHPVSLETEDVHTELRLMIAAASPVGPGLDQLNVEKEIELLAKALDDLAVDDFKLKLEPILRDATPPDVFQALSGAGSVQFFHFAGHGDSEIKTDPFTRGAERVEGVLYFVGDKTTKKAQKVRADDLAKLLQQANVWLATMDACYSGARSERNPWDSVAGALVRRDIPAVVAMQYEVSDAESINFTKAFYTSLASGLSLDEAMSFARIAMYEESSEDLDKIAPLEWGVPVLYSRLSDGVIVRNLVERESKTADNIRRSIEQIVDTVERDGVVIGIDTDEAIGGTVEQRMKRVDGEVIGYRQRSRATEETNDDAPLDVSQDVDTVSGSLVGARFD